MNRPDLAELGLHLPPLAVTSAGPLPATAALREARRAHACSALSDAELAEETQRACEYWIAVQDRLGVDVLVDGNLDGRDLVCRFANGLAGFTPGGLVRLYGDRYRRKPIIAGPVSWREPITVADWQSLQATTTRPLKARVTGPYTLTCWSFDAHYGSREAACLAIAAALRQELNALVAAGARVIQIDEPALAEPGAAWGLATEAMRLVTSGIGAYVVAWTGGRDDIGIGAAGLVLPVDNIDLPTLADDNTLPADMHATIDVFGPGAHEKPTAEAIDQCLQAAIAAVGSERLWVSSSGRLGYETPESAEAHLEAIVHAAAIARGGPAVAAPAVDETEPATAPVPADEILVSAPTDEDPPSEQ